MGKSTISMAMFNSYVKLPEGISHDHPIKFTIVNHGKSPFSYGFLPGFHDSGTGSPVPYV